MFDLESYTLKEPREFECEECGDIAEITAIAKAGKTFSGIQIGKDSGESGWEPTDTGWCCPTCANDE